MYLRKVMSKPQETIPSLILWVTLWRCGGGGTWVYVSPSMPLPRPNVRKPPVQRAAAAAAAAAAKVRFRPGSEPDGRDKVFTEGTYCEALSTNLPFRTTQIILAEDLRVSRGDIIPLIALWERLLITDKLSRFQSGSWVPSVVLVSNIKSEVKLLVLSPDMPSVWTLSNHSSSPYKWYVCMWSNLA